MLLVGHLNRELAVNGIPLLKCGTDQEIGKQRWGELYLAQQIGYLILSLAIWSRPQ